MNDSILNGKPDIERPADSTLKVIFHDHKVSLSEKVFLYRKSNVVGNMYLFLLLSDSNSSQ